MLAVNAQPADLPRGSADWVLERKIDGLRCIAARSGPDVRLWSRNRLPYTERFSHLVAALKELPVESFVLDGEVAAFGPDGTTSFAGLQRPAPGVTVSYCAFDILSLLDHDTSELPLRERRQLLSRLLGDSSEALRLPEEVAGEAGPALASACERGWEGLVAKRLDEGYTSGRSSSWLKLKCVGNQEMVIGGWTEPRSTRVGFGALLVGYNDRSGLRYAGKVGTGFDAATLTSLHAELQARATSESPFVDDVGAALSGSRSPSAARRALQAVHWVRPELVAQVGFTEWTPDGRLRHPRFEGLRSDKKPSEVTRER